MPRRRNRKRKAVPQAPLRTMADYYRMLLSLPMDQQRQPTHEGFLEYAHLRSNV